MQINRYLKQVKISFRICFLFILCNFVPLIWKNIKIIINKKTQVSYGLQNF